MEDPTVEWKIQEFQSEDNRVSYILNKGWELGKKIAITALAVSSAPLVLPPLVVFSTLGFAFAVPFGMVFASYACTEKIMSKLLSRPTPSPMLEYGENGGEGMDWEKEGDEQELMEDMRLSIEARIELVDEKGGYDEEEMVGEEENSQVGIEWNRGEPLEGDGRDDRNLGSFEEEEKPMEERNVIIEEQRRADGNSGDLVEGDEKPSEETKGTTMKPIRETTKVKGESRGEENGDNAIEAEEKIVEETQGTTMEERREEGKVGNVEPEEKPMRNTEGVLEVTRHGKNVDNAIKEKKKAGKKKKGITKEQKDQANVDKVGKEGRPIEGRDGKTEKESAIPSYEVLYSEEKIWEQIDAVRKIVGYKAAPHATCIEELKSLYLFAGVEPPASFKDHPDLVEVNDKLHFLMKVVGVK